MRINALSIGYNNSAPILQDIDAELIDGQLVALIGRNGSGKSTLLRTIAGLILPISGNIVGQKPAIALTQTPHLKNTTVSQMVSYGRLPYTGFFGRIKPEDQKIADQALSSLGIEALAHRLFCDLSDGEKQKVMIARALAQQTTTLLLDEPSAFLDYPSKRQLMQCLQQLAHSEHKSILISTHDIELAKQFADQLWIIDRGQLKTGINPATIDITKLFEG